MWWVCTCQSIRGQLQVQNMVTQSPTCIHTYSPLVTAPVLFYLKEIFQYTGLCPTECVCESTMNGTLIVWDLSPVTKIVNKCRSYTLFVQLKPFQLTLQHMDAACVVFQKMLSLCPTCGLWCPAQTHHPVDLALLHWYCPSWPCQLDQDW